MRLQVCLYVRKKNRSPMKRIIVTIVSGTFIFFLWNAISWMVLPFHSSSLHTIPESALETQKLKKEQLEDGIYHYPGLPKDNSSEEIQKTENKLKEGPRITFMAYKRGSTSLFEFKTFGINLLLNLSTVCLILFAIQKLGDKSLKNILMTTSCLALMVGFASDFPQMNWFMFPLDFVLPYVLDYIVSFTLLGLLLALYTFKGSSDDTRANG